MTAGSRLARDSVQRASREARGLLPSGCAFA
jgi:hypothetical protein